MELITFSVMLLTPPPPLRASRRPYDILNTGRVKVLLCNARLTIVYVVSAREYVNQKILLYVFHPLRILSTMIVCKGKRWAEHTRATSMTRPMLASHTTLLITYVYFPVRQR